MNVALLSELRSQLRKSHARIAGRIDPVFGGARSSFQSAFLLLTKQARFASLTAQPVAKMNPSAPGSVGKIAYPSGRNLDRVKKLDAFANLRQAEPKAVQSTIKKLFAI